MWCERCGHNVTKEFIEEHECPYWECPMENKIVNVGDDLHQALADAVNEQLTRSDGGKMMVDGGAPQISAAQVEFERMASHWQNEARIAAETAAYYASLAGSLKEVYRTTVAQHTAASRL